MDCCTENSGLEIALVIRTRGYQIMLDVSEGEVRVSRVRPGTWNIALRRRRCGTC
jgi:hypothetical protein